MFEKTKYLAVAFAVWIAALSNAACSTTTQQHRANAAAVEELGREALSLLSDEILCMKDRPMPEEAGPAYVLLNEGCIYYDSAQLIEAWKEHGRGAVLGVMAHELAHVIVRAAHSPSWESQFVAANVAGCALARANESAGGYISYLESLIGANTPRMKLRTEATMRGVARCGG